MKIENICVICCWFWVSSILMAPNTLWAAEEYGVPTVKDLADSKKFYDDPNPWYLSDKFDYKKILPARVYSALSHDVGAMEKLWNETVGFKAPDEVRKIAPEIKPGTYSYKDKEQYPGLKALMTDYHYNRFKPGAPPLAGNFPEIKIVPTKQYYYSLPIAEATKKFAGKTKLNHETGFIRDETYVAGYPFPRPEGKWKAYQVYYNWIKRYLGWDSKYLLSDSRGFTRSLREDNVIISDNWALRLNGRVMEPFGWLDKRAQGQGEAISYSMKFYAPRDLFGNILNRTDYLNADKYEQLMTYVNVLRRVRLMSSTDVQDAVGGGDAIYLDFDGCTQKLSMTVFPTNLEIIDETELLFPTNHTGSAYLTSMSKGLEYHNLVWERRPVYIVKMTILDKHFVYGHRILYFDRETFNLYLAENYDQKGRLYRTTELIFTFVHDMGAVTYGDTLLQDHIDLHSSLAHNYTMPTPWIHRDKISLEYLFTTGK
ncbi:MAG: DUF1329 domain-containing protein [Desulfatitalea sp.]|nr:DUF1329 domain-containing protein [Desulfatitalea sp.]NNK02840.1 DUF1329 domain-containing protein [Desulfatitalea sp.]